MSKRYILEGPANAGNVFGVWKRGLVPAGRWAVVENDEYANGGRGPCTVDGKLYSSRSEARAALAAINGPQWCSECGEFFPHMLSGNCCVNCRNAAFKEATA